MRWTSTNRHCELGQGRSRAAIVRAHVRVVRDGSLKRLSRVLGTTIVLGAIRQLLVSI